MAKVEDKEQAADEALLAVFCFGFEVQDAGGYLTKAAASFADKAGSKLAGLELLRAGGVVAQQIGEARERLQSKMRLDDQTKEAVEGDEPVPKQSGIKQLLRKYAQAELGEVLPPQFAADASPQQLRTVAAWWKRQNHARYPPAHVPSTR